MRSSHLNAFKCLSNIHRHPRQATLCAYFATPSSALKQSANCLLCLFEACSVRSLRFVVLWKVWKQVLHLTVWAAVFYVRSVVARSRASAWSQNRTWSRTDFSCDLASLGPSAPLRSRFCCALRAVSMALLLASVGRRTWLRYPCC
jgi:hypothetical protein